MNHCERSARGLPVVGVVGCALVAGVVGCALVVGSVGCAHAPPPVNPKASINKARRACTRLGQTTLDVPIKTDIESRMKQIRQALAANQKRKAMRLADLLADDCGREADRRADISSLIDSVSQMRNEIDPALYGHFMDLVQRGQYSQAILCGEGLLQNQPDRCDEKASADRRMVTRVRMRADGTVIKRVRSYETAAPMGKKAKPPGDTRASADRRTSADTRTSADRRTTERISASDFAVDEMVEATPTSTGRHWPWIVMGSGAALLIGGAIAAGMAQGRYDDLERTCPECSQGDIDSGKRMALSADILLGAGAAAAIGGIIWYVVQARASGGRRSTGRRSTGRRSTGALLVPTAGGAVLEGRF